MKIVTYMCMFAVFVVVGFIPVNDANAIAVTTFCNPTTNPNRLGIADAIDATNAVKTDDALICLDIHDYAGLVNTQNEWRNEVANSGSHELGHLLGLTHADGDGATLMNGLYDGIDKAFKAGSQTKLDALAGAQVVWLDFLAASPELPANTYKPFALTPIITTTLMLNAAQIDALIAEIVVKITADYAFLTAPPTLTFVTTMPVAGDYSTISFVSNVPVPAALLLFLSGAGILGFLGKRHGRRN